jgi:aminoglycoside phosphotransferase family enzyme
VLVEDLARPEAYPPPRPATVGVITTHISWVFVTDGEVWKVKRPVDYGFVDYTTLDRRRHFCDEEVRLNRRLAPDVYLGVVPVRLDGGRHSLAGSGPIVDYAVRMRRLPDAASAERLLADGVLGHEHLARLAARLAAFYAASAPEPAPTALDVLRANVEENFSQAEGFVGRLLARETFDTVRDWQRERLARDAGLFEARRVQGRIRDGHGDLRLEHVYFERDEPTVIDTIEFNERFRVADVAADVAFLAMELDARSRPDLAAGFLAAFATESDDHDLYAVVDFYLSYRAWVRAKVAALLATDPSTEPAKVRRKAQEAERLFALACTYAEPRPEALPVIAVGGLIGAGKSTQARALGRVLGVPVIDSHAPTSSWARAVVSCWTPPSAAAICVGAPARSPSATGVRSGSWRPSATTPRCARGCAPGPRASRCPTPPRTCWIGFGASSSRWSSSLRASTSPSARPSPSPARSTPSATRCAADAARVSGTAAARPEPARVGLPRAPPGHLLRRAAR